MSLKCVPLLFLNLGGEMAYILQQRLQAQNVNNDKTIRVLTDILHTMFNTKFLEELFKPQPVYSRRIMRIFFERLVHSSIMRLSETSMDKLYDLMTMAYKYQLQLCNGPEYLVLITLNHLDCVRKILPKDEVLNRLLEVAHHKVIVTYHEIPLWEQALIRSCLLNFFQDIRVKVTLLLRENRQTEEGRFILFPETCYQLPYNGNAPGKIRYFGSSKTADAETFIAGDNARMYEPCTLMGNVQLQSEYRGTDLGINMYTTQESLQVEGGGASFKPEVPAPGDELRLLSALIAPQQKQQKGFDLNLFTNDVEEKTFVQERDEALARMAHIDATKNHKTINAAVADLKLDDAPLSRRSKKGEDVLNLLDQVAKTPATAARSCIKRGTSSLKRK